ncbi:uncharacterized protein (DUF2252 family) [Krasilnikovia cinnamomea]|uniref:Uncharacterized protein (DUF2252 family) n=1 Tax=Krasilnikovia cinnamomea TaxID=349313 RepID=A0A4Q7ZH82_9ACTN|nr:DUF2252 domain-containing protein [Krasilnikovia cinnamomea]RZU49429.1 uncharacterized protein (DUF2252 family) [Krasilnikovia cinnamomea]
MTGRKASATAPAQDPAARLKAGKAARRAVPFEAHAELPAAADRPDPVELLIEQGATRVPELVPIRYGRMLVSPFTFFRGAAAVMAADLARTPATGLNCQLCGDAHLSNFGAFASPERRLVFDINDFDETYPGPWEWDVKRLAASLAVAARGNGFRRKERAAVVAGAVSRYRQAMSEFAEQRELDVWYARADLDEVNVLLRDQMSKAKRKRLEQAQAKARTRDSMQAFRKMTAMVDGHRRIVADPPLIVPIDDLLPDEKRAEFEQWIRQVLDGYAETLSPDRRHLLGAFQFVDLARKVVGVGSVGTRCWVVLLSGRDPDDPLLLQVKEAPPSVLAAHVPDGKAAGYPSEGQRVVTGQRLMQAVSDIFLGWQTIEGVDGRTRDFYVRQLRDWKGSAVVEAMDPEGMQAYAALCGWTLARAHARTGDRIAIAGYLTGGAGFDQALVEFAERYADLNERDFQTLAAAGKAGRIPVHSGV